MTLKGDAKKIYDAHSDLGRDKALVASVWWCSHCGGHGLLLRSDDIRYVGNAFVPFEDEYWYAARLTALMNQCSALSGDKLPNPGLYYIRSAWPYDQIHSCDNLRHWTKKITIKRRHMTRGSDIAQFVRWCNVEYYAIPSHHWSQFFINVLY